jgi:hypothetical protein
MTAIKLGVIWLIIDCAAGLMLAGEPTVPPTQMHDPEAPGTMNEVYAERDMRADKRYEEMLGKMQAAVEQIAQLYGNPLFLQVYTNDADRALELKERLKADRRGRDLRLEVEGLEKKRDELLDEIALKERQTRELSEKLIRQRLALDNMSTAIEQAKRSVDDTTR